MYLKDFFFSSKHFAKFEKSSSNTHIYFQASSFMTAVNKYTTTGQCTYSASGTYSSCPSNTLFPCAAATCMNADIVAIGSICSKRRKREALLPDFSFKGKK